MFVFWIVYVIVIDFEVYGKYVEFVGFVIVKYGGYFIVCVGCFVQFEGKECLCNVVVKFLDVDIVVVCYYSLEY